MGSVVVLGRGKDARVWFHERKGVMHGVRILVNADAPSSVRLGVDQLVAQGFTERDDNLPTLLHTQGSEWTACAVEIGDAKKSWKTGIISELVDESWLSALPWFQPSIPPTLVMVAARALPNGATELVMYPHSSRAGDPTSFNGAMPRFRAATDAIIAAATQAGRFISSEKMRGITNDGSPASQQAVRELLNWK